MTTMLTTAKIVRYDGRFLLLEPTEDISRVLSVQHQAIAELRLDDGRMIRVDQRKKIFALIGEIAKWNGDTPEDIRSYLTWEYCKEYGVETFSLSDTTVTIATGFITFLIDFCFYHDVPARDTRLHYTDDISKYLYLCLAHRKCAICNKQAEVHHVDRIGMGRDREQIVHIGLEAIALCREHHDEAHRREKDLFREYCIYGIKLDKYLCECLNLNTRERIR